MADKTALALDTESLGTIFQNLVSEIDALPTAPEVVPAVDVKITLRMHHSKKSGFLWSKSADSAITVELATRIQRSTTETDDD